MRIALAQMEVIPGVPRRNLETMLGMIDEAKRQHVDLLAFPEMAVGGYLLGDNWLSDSSCLDLMRYNQPLFEASDGIALAWGNVFLDPDASKRLDNRYRPNKDGRTRKYNAIYIAQNGKPVERAYERGVLPAGVQPKTLLPNYRFFDDERYFFSLADIALDYGLRLEALVQPYLLEVNGKKVPVGFELCEDLWCEDYRRYGSALNPTKILIQNGAEAIVNISASPWTYGKNGARDRRVQFLKKESGDAFVPFFYVNCVGAQNNGKNIITFDGGSTVYNKDGLPVLFGAAPYKQELLLIDDTDRDRAPIERVETAKIAQKYDAIIRGIQHMKDIRGFDEHQPFVIGLSGGIDSAVVAALLAQAVGREKVIAINMPSQYNSEKTKNTAAYVAKKLGIEYKVVSIEELSQLNQSVLEAIDPAEHGTLPSLQIENIQAKIRGTTLLSNIAAMYQAMFTNNGNKLEIALGYATLYGDVGGGIAPLGDLTKVEVVEMATYINNEIFHDEIIPESLIPDALWRFREDQIQPSAELKEKQVDPMKFGYHDALLEAMTDYQKKTPEDILQWYIDGTLEENLGIGTDFIRRWDIDDPKIFVEDLTWFASMMQRSIFKRVQAPPIIVTSKSAYGYDIRESMLPYRPTQRYKELEQHILMHMTSYCPKEEKK